MKSSTTPPRGLDMSKVMEMVDEEARKPENSIDVLRDRSAKPGKRPIPLKALIGQTYEFPDGTKRGEPTALQTQAIIGIGSRLAMGVGDSPSDMLALQFYIGMMCYWVVERAAKQDLRQYIDEGIPDKSMLNMLVDDMSTTEMLAWSEYSTWVGTTFFNRQIQETDQETA